MITCPSCLRKAVRELTLRERRVLGPHLVAWNIICDEDIESPKMVFIVCDNCGELNFLLRGECWIPKEEVAEILKGISDETESSDT